MQRKRKSLAEFFKDFGGIVSGVTTLVIAFNAFFQMIRSGPDGTLLALLVSGTIVAFFLISFYFAFVWIPASGNKGNASSTLILPRHVFLRGEKKKSENRIKNAAYVALVSIPIIICLDLLGWLILQDSYLWRPLYIAQLNSQELPEFSNACANAKHNIEVRHPPSWQCQKVKNPFTQTVLLLSPQKGTIDIEARVKLVVQMYSTLALQSLEELLSDHTAALEAKRFENFNLVDISKTIFFEQGAYKLEYMAKDRDAIVHYKELITLKEGTAYIVTYTAEEPVFPKYERIADEIAKTLKLTDV